jgi:cAMP phosphodiesterase
MGIPFLADNIIVGNVSQKVTIMSISPVIRIIKKHLLNSSVWPDFTVIPHPDDGILNLVKLKPDKPVRIRDYMITPYEVNHTVSAVGYLVEDKEEKRFFYTGDTGPSAKTWENIGDRQIHSLIIDVSFPNSMGDVAIRTGHLTPDLLREELLKLHHMPEYIYITHPKPQHYKTIKNELDKLKMKKLRLLRDGDTIRI